MERPHSRPTSSRAPFRPGLGRAAETLLAHTHPRDSRAWRSCRTSLAGCRVGFSESSGLGQHDRGVPTTLRIAKKIRVLQGGTMYEVTEWGALLLGRAGKTSDGRDKGGGPGVLDMHSL